MLGTSYAVSEDDYSITSGEGFPDDPLFGQAMQYLVSLVGKVIDHTKKPRAVSYSSILAIDIELEHFGSQLPKDPWKFPPPAPGDHHSEIPFKRPEMGLMVLLFFQARLQLHLSWMVGSLNDRGLDYSRSGCFESATTIVQMFKDVRGANSHFPIHKCAPVDLVAFVAAAVLCLGQFGYAPASDDANRLEEYGEMVKSTIEVFGRLRTDVARQSISNLKQLVELQDKWDAGEPVPRRITVPFLGSVDIPERRKNSFGQHLTTDAMPAAVAGQAEFNSLIEPAMAQPDAASYTLPFDLASFPLIPQNSEGQIMATPEAYMV
jgi:hypothetical protein